MASYRRMQLAYLALVGTIVGFAWPAAHPPASDPDPAAAAAPARSAIDRLREAAGDLAQDIRPQTYRAAAALIRLNGYDCPHADLLIRYAFSEGYSVYCRGGRYIFELQNHGGRWSVTPP
jgi:hypothetical protein